MWCNGNNNRVIDSVNDNKERVYVKKKIFFQTFFLFLVILN